MQSFVLMVKMLINSNDKYRDGVSQVTNRMVAYYVRFVAVLRQQQHILMISNRHFWPTLLCTVVARSG